MKTVSFFGQSQETMEVHIGKTHTDTFECGLCAVKLEIFKNWKHVKFIDVGNVITWKIKFLI